MWYGWGMDWACAEVSAKEGKNREWANRCHTQPQSVREHVITDDNRYLSIITDSRIRIVDYIIGDSIISSTSIYYPSTQHMILLGFPSKLTRYNHMRLDWLIPPTGVTALCPPDSHIWWIAIGWVTSPVLPILSHHCRPYEARYTWPWRVWYWLILPSVVI